MSNVVDIFERFSAKDQCNKIPAHSFSVCFANPGSCNLTNTVAVLLPSLESLADSMKELSTTTWMGPVNRRTKVYVFM